jgi:hypothetical protein
MQIYFNQEISTSYAILNSDMQCNKFSKIQDTRWCPYMAKTCSEEEGWLDNKLHLRQNCMRNKWYGTPHSSVAQMHADLCHSASCQGLQSAYASLNTSKYRFKIFCRQCALWYTHHSTSRSLKLLESSPFFAYVTLFCPLKHTRIPDHSLSHSFPPKEFSSPIS